MTEGFSMITGIGKKMKKPLSTLSTTSVSTILEVDVVSSKKDFDDFDYTAHWVPVSWKADIPYNKPTKVTVFDVDYVVSRIKPSGDDEDGEDEVIAVVDRCPHKAAKLSEGRVTDCGKMFQCAYHGWSFDGKDGSCKEIPQTITLNKGDDDVVIPNFGSSSMINAQAVPVMISQNMVWLLPDGNLEKALTVPPPPKIPEIDETDEFNMYELVRDFPVDWPILVENILDPDHGLFAHASPIMDMYTGKPEATQKVSENEKAIDKGWDIVSRTDAVDNLIHVNEIRTKESKKADKKKKKKENSDSPPLVATSTFEAPYCITLSRRDTTDNNSTKFINAFWVTPTGVGKSRFMSAGILKSKFVPPRWLFHLIINNFLDEDTFLLYTQQQYLLTKEAEFYRNLKEEKEGENDMNSRIRQKSFIFRSPTEKLQNRLRAFFDATLHRVPNRKEILLSTPSSSFGDLPRSAVLDRFNQHTLICQNSKDTLENCKTLKKVSKNVTIFLWALKSFVSFSSSVQVMKKGIVGSAIDLVMKVMRKMDSVVTLRVFLAISILSFFVHKYAGKLEKEFYFKQDEGVRDNHLAKITKNWADPTF